MGALCSKVQNYVDWENHFIEVERPTFGHWVCAEGFPAETTTRSALSQFKRQRQILAKLRAVVQLFKGDAEPLEFFGYDKKQIQRGLGSFVGIKHAFWFRLPTHRRVPGRFKGGVVNLRRHPITDRAFNRFHPSSFFLGVDDGSFVHTLSRSMSEPSLQRWKTIAVLGIWLSSGLPGGKEGISPSSGLSWPSLTPQAQKKMCPMSFTW